MAQRRTESEHGEQRRSRHPEAHFRTFFEHAPIGEAIVRIDGRYLQVNRALCELVGFSQEELLGSTFQSITHPDDLHTDLELSERLVAGEIASYEMEKRYVHRSGELVWVHLSVSLVRDEEAAPLYFIAQIQDIRERKAAEAALRESERRLAEAQKIARLGSWEWDVATGEVTWSKELYSIRGFDPATAITYETVADGVHPDDREQVQEVVRHAIATGEPMSIEYRVLRPDGAIRWVQGRGEVVHGPDGPLGMHGIAQDVTETKHAEELLRDAERRYRTLVEQLPLVTYIRALALDEPNVYVSPQVEAMLGYTAEEWQSDPDLLARIVHPDDRERVLDAARSVRETGEPFRGEYRYVKPDGSIVWVQDETYLIRDQHGTPVSVQGYLFDISERKRAEHERDRFQHDLLHAQKLEAVGQLAGGVAHEFNNMLMAITGHGSLLLSTLDESSPLRRNVEQIMGSAERATALTRQLLAFGRKQVLERATVDVNGAVEASMRLLRPLVAPRVDLRLQLHPSLPAITADPTQVEQVLINLVLNARDAIDGEGTITLATRVVQLDQATAARDEVAPGSYVAVSVTDTGHGMDEDVRSRIFEPFFTTKPPGQGSGLGLSTAYGIVRQCGGVLRVESLPGRGTTMTVLLAAGTQSPPEHDREPPAPARPVALVVDDEEVVRNICAALLDGLGYEVLTAPDGHAALELLPTLQDPPELLLTDIVMPGLRGPALAAEITACHPHTNVLFMSGYPGDGLEVGGLAVERQLLQKPFGVADLKAKVQELVHAQTAATPAADTRAIACAVVDDHPAVLDAACGVLERAGLDVVARAGTAADALPLIAHCRPDVAVVDVALPDGNGVEVASRIHAASPGTRVLLYTGAAGDTLVDDARAVGAGGVVLKDSPLGELVAATKVVAHDGFYVDRSLAGGNAPTPVRVTLTGREVQILRSVANGNTNEQVGRALQISPETVQTHIRNAMKKLGAETRTQAVAVALRRRLIS
jgi:two-component system cell cycle sensor histidine kinase/response regulator CckA